MNKAIIRILIKLFTLVDGRLPQNFCKVFAVANIAGFLFAVACVEGPYMVRAIACGIICLLLVCFFGSMAALYEEVYGD